MNYKEKYEMALETIQEILESGSDSIKMSRLRLRLQSVFPEIRESKDERIRKEIIKFLELPHPQFVGKRHQEDWLAWLEKQGEQKPTQEIEPFEAEHGKYYYCIKDYFCGGRKQASKGDVVQALRGLPIMGLKDAGEYFLPVNSIKCNSAWSEEDEEMLVDAYVMLDWYKGNNWWTARRIKDWLNSLKERIGE